MRKYLLVLIGLALFIGCGGETTARVGVTLKNTSSNYKTQSARDVKLDIIGSIPISSGRALDIVISKDGRFAYVATGEGVEIFDISSPESPSRVYDRDLDDFINRVEVIDGILYAVYEPRNGEGYYTVNAFDVDNSYYPRYLGRREGRYGTPHYHIKRDHYYYELNNEGLEIYALSNSHVAKRVGRVYLGDYAYALALKGRYIFVANGLDGVTIIRSSIGYGSVGRFISTSKK